MAEWSDSRIKALADETTQFLSGLALHPRLRQRIAARGYTEQVHRSLQACLTRASDLGTEGGARRWAAETGSDPSRGWRALGGLRVGQARAVLGWAVHQARLASQAVTKVPTVVRELGRLADEAGEAPPLETFLATRKLVERVGGDEHLGHFLTLGGLKDASRELRQRLREGGSDVARAARTQAHAELAFLYSRWRQVALREFAGEPSALHALGLSGS